MQLSVVPHQLRVLIADPVETSSKELLVQIQIACERLSLQANVTQISSVGGVDIAGLMPQLIFITSDMIRDLELNPMWHRLLVRKMNNPLIVLLVRDEPVNGSDNSGLSVSSDTYFLGRLLTDQQTIGVLIRTAWERQKQHALIESMLAAVNEHAIVAITDPDGIITYVNKEFCRLSEYTEEELVGRGHGTISSGHHSKEFFQGMWATIKAGKIWQGEICNRTRSGRPFWLQTTIIPFVDSDNRVYQYVTIRTDVTRLKDAQQEAIDRVVRKANFLANVTHELRTPIHSISGIAQMLKEEQLPDRPRRLIDALEDASEMLLGTVNDLLDFTKIEQNLVSLECIAVDVADILRRAYAMFRPMADEKGIGLRLDLPISIPKIMGDPTRLRQIVVNLVGNALKFTDRGEVVLSARVIVTEGEKITIRLQVSDSGIGMSEATLGKIFRPFEQADRSTGRRFGGTGLGLSITKNLVDLMDGEINVQSMEGHGSTFRVEIPFLSARSETKAPSLDGVSFEGSCVIIIDDDELNQMVTSAMLQRLGLRVVSFMNAGDGLAWLQKNHADAVLLDSQLPDISGAEAVLQIRSWGSKYESLPVVAVTGEVLPDDVDFRDLGYSAYLTKPVGLTGLRQTLSGFLITSAGEAGSSDQL